MIASCLAAGTQRSLDVVDDTLCNTERFMRSNGRPVFFSDSIDLIENQNTIPSRCILGCTHLSLAATSDIDEFLK